jgi:hypothetical protein
MRYRLTVRPVVVVLAVLLLAARGADAGTSLTLMWDPNPDPVVAGYVVYVGTQSGVYTQSHDVGDTNWFVLQGATPGQRYYLAVASYAAGPVVGPRSAEVSGYSNAPPTLVQPAHQNSVIGRVVSLQLQGSDPYGEPVSYGASGLPPGLMLTPATGFIQGTGTVAGSYQVTAWVTDGVLSAQRQFTWTMSESSSGSSDPAAQDPPPVAPDTTPPVVAITAPSSAGSFASSLMTLTLAGTAADNVGVTTVSWSNSRGGSGVAAGTAQWTISGVPLQVGTNVITVTARDAAGNQGSTSVTVTYVDSEAPVLTLTSPGAVSVVQTYADTVTLGGMAWDNVGVTQVSWSADSGLRGIARGTAAWSLGPVAVEPGTTRVVVSAADAAGNRGSLLVTVMRLVAMEPMDAVVIGPDGEAFETSDPVRQSITGTTVISTPEQEAGSSVEGLGAGEPPAAVLPPAESTATAGTTTLRVAMAREESGGGLSTPVTTFSRTPRTAQTAPSGSSTTTTVTGPTSVQASVPLLMPADLTPALSAVDGAMADEPEPAREPAGDRTAPKVTITSPTDTGVWETTEERIFVVGVAVDDVGVTGVTWRTSAFERGTAEGTSVWSFEVPLEPGANVITVTARDAAGNVGHVVLSITRR